MILEENKPLAPLTTFGIGGPARWLVEAANEEQIVEAAEWARQRRVPLFVLGGGSNLLVSDQGFDGLVLRVCLRGIDRIDAEPERQSEAPSPQFVYRAAAGEDWDSFVQRTVHDNCAGIECLAGIPGTVGGTPVQDVGAYGQEVATAICRVRAFDLVDRRFVEFSPAECNFSYRRSRFNSADRGRYIVARVDFQLTHGGEPAVSYAELRRALADHHPGGAQPGLAEVAAAVRQIRRSKGMLLVDGDPDCRSAGSFFKNPVVTEDRLRQIAGQCGQQPPRFPAGTDIEGVGLAKIPAAWLIEQCGFGKGYVMGAAGVSSRHTLALINRGGASASEILALATRIQEAVEDRFGVHLEMEPVLVGF